MNLFDKPNQMVLGPKPEQAVAITQHQPCFVGQAHVQLVC